MQILHYLEIKQQHIISLYLRFSNPHISSITIIMKLTIRSNKQFNKRFKVY